MTATGVARLPYESDIPERVGVLVLGSGLAGCAALLAASEAGGSAVMLEKTDAIGGSTVKSGGLAAFAGTDEQIAEGITDSAELLRDDLLVVGRHHNDEALVDLYCAHQLETYRWLKHHGVVYGEIHAGAGQSVPRGHSIDTTAMLVHLLEAAGRMGARLIMNAGAERFVCEQGRVVGAEVVTPGGRRRQILADAVVLATGGFAQSPDLLTTFAPQMERALRAGGVGCQGDGLKMGLAVGAGIRDTPYIKGTYGIYPEPHPDEHGTGILAIYKGAIAVNRQGERFVDESLGYKEVGDVALAQPGLTTWQIFDAQVMAHSTDEVPIYDFAGRAHMLLQAETITELEEQLPVPPGSLQATVADYNARIRQGEADSLGRVHLSGGYGDPFPLDRPPFYAHPSGVVVLATYCGLTIDTRLRVRNWWGEPIEGLYAAGEVVGGLHGAGYVTGTAIGKAGIFGRLAGMHAAQRVSEATAS